MGYRSIEPVGNAAFNEAELIIQDLELPQNDNPVLTQETERSIKKMEQHTKNVLKAADVMAGSWTGKIGERSNTWDNDVTV